MTTCRNSKCCSAACRRAIELFERGFTRGAIDILEVELAKSPHNGHLWRLRAVLLHQGGQLLEALDNIERAQLLVPLDHYGQLILADGLCEVGRDALAADTYHTLAKQPGLDLVVLNGLYAGFAKLGHWRDAARVCRLALEQTPDDDTLLFALARSLMQLEQPADAIVPLLRRAVQLAPTVQSYRVALVVQLVKQRRCDEAYTQLRMLPAAAIDSVCCHGCLRRLIALAIEFGDGPRASAFAAQLAGEVANVKN